METEMKESYIFARYFGLQNKPSSGAKKEKKFVLQTEISGKYITLYIISVSILISQSFRRKDQFTVIYFRLQDFY